MLISLVKNNFFKQLNVKKGVNTRKTTVGLNNRHVTFYRKCYMAKTGETELAVIV